MTYPERAAGVVGRGGYPTEFYEAVARRYLELARTHGRRIAPVIAEEAGATVTAVHGWVIRARELGFLPEAKDIDYAPMRMCTCGQGPVLHAGNASVGGRPVRAPAGDVVESER